MHRGPEPLSGPWVGLLERKFELVCWPSEALRIAVNIAVLTPQGLLIDDIYEGKRRLELSGQRPAQGTVSNARQGE